PIKKILLWVLVIVVIVLSITGIYIYRNFNQLLSDALLKTFNSSTISDVYELKFERLRVNPLQGNIKVFNVVMQPRKKPLHDYPYINSTLRLSTHKLLLRNVQLIDLLKSNILQLDRIEITEPEVELNITDNIPIFFPFKDSTVVAAEQKKSGKKPIGSFLLKEFELVNASIQAINSARQREISVRGFSISVKDLMIQQLPGKDIISYNHIELAIGELNGKMMKEALKYVSFKDYELTLDTLKVQKSIDTLIYHFADFSTGVKMLDIQTADSTFHISLNSFHLGYKDKAIQLNGFSFEPNVSNAVLQAKSRFQKTEFSGSVDTLNITGLDFDSLIYARKLLIDEIQIEKLKLSLYKDKSKPVDRKKFPEYLAQKIAAIPLPMQVKSVKATGVSFVNVERKEDGKYAKVIIQRGALTAKNITNLPAGNLLSIKVSGYLENKVFLTLDAGFSYKKPQFNIKGKIGKSDLKDLNKLLAAYSPAAIKKGMIDEITFSGMVYRTHSSGTMKFLYHDLDVDLKLTDKNWQNSVVGFAANSYLNASNPPSPDKPPRVVTYHAERDMNKGGFNIILKSVLNGLKETMIMSKENKKAYKEEKKKWKTRK
ncbi:MAG: hypothetical protein HGA37_09630, partial [Lentimicrobium sp.]|nr:hypothetical protein [Lentimicrobium sp.]